MQEKTPITQKIQVGDTVKPFTAKIQDGSEIESSKVLATNNFILLVFYPGDDTPGCTKQLCGIRDIYQEYKTLGVKIFGVNHGNEESHKKFINKYDYKFDIIVDENKKLVEEFGAIGSFFGNPTVKRGVFLIDKDHKIAFKHWGQQNNEKIIDMLKDNS